MSISILNNVTSLAAQNSLSMTQASLQKTLQQLSTGSRLNTGADDAAGLAIADGLNANISALKQSAHNASDGIGSLQVADGALSQVTALLNRAVTLATEASTGTVSDTQRTTINAEFTAIKAEIDSIGSTTNYNGAQVFSATATAVYLSDGTSGGASSITVTTGALSSSAIGFSGTPVSLGGNDLTSVTNAKAALTNITSAIAGVAADRGALGAEMNRLQAASSVMSNEVQNLTTAADNIRAADIPSAVSSMSRLTVLQQTGMAALQQSNQMQQSVLKLLQ